MKRDKKIRLTTYESPCGCMVIGIFEDEVCLCDWAEAVRRCNIVCRLERRLQAVAVEEVTALSNRVVGELKAYFSGSLQVFDLPLCLVGTDFQIKVWQGLQSIPYGTTVSYSALSRQLKMPEALRAVACAVGSNLLSILVPCHRVVGSRGQLTGYRGGLAAKKYLLARETG